MDRRLATDGGDCAASGCFLGDSPSRRSAFSTIAITLSWRFLTPLTCATESAFFGELFETRVRYSGVNAGQQLSGVISAGLLPVFAVSALQWTGGDPWPIAAFGMFMGLVIVISALAAHETYKVDLDAVTPRQLGRFR